jgi:hypothetical protein
MKTIAFVAAPLLVVLLTWLSLRAVNTGAERFDRALAELDRITETDAALHRDVLSARAGLLRNYDPLVRETDALDAAVARLSAIMTPDATAAAAIDRLAESIARQEAMVEQFKSMNALLQNSLAYFTRFSAAMTAPEQGNTLAPTVSMLAAAMLRLALDTSAASALAVQEQLDEFARQIPSDSVGPGAALLAHGRLLHELLPATDGILRMLYAVPHRRDQAEVRSIILTEQGASRATARRGCRQAASAQGAGGTAARGLRACAGGRLDALCHRPYDGSGCHDRSVTRRDGTLRRRRACVFSRR